MKTRLARFSGVASALDELPLPAREREFSSSRPIWGDSEAADSLFVMERGHAFAFTIFPNGRRHISDFFGPGSICNWTRLRSSAVKMNIMFRPGSAVSILKRSEVIEALDNSRILESAINRHEMARTLRTSQRTRALIAMNGSDRFMTLLLDFHSELRAAGLAEDIIELPFSQAEIADIIGQTNVHVSRLLKALEQDSRIERLDGARFRIKDMDRELERLDYRDPFLKMRREAQAQESAN